MVKLLVTSDIHNDKYLIDKLMELYDKEKPDYVILLGDLSVSGDLDINLLEKISKKINPKKVIVIPGNHDFKEIIYEISKRFGWIDLDFRYMHIRDKFTFIGVGGADIYLYIVEEDEIRNFFEKIKNKIEGRYIILLSHMPPLSSPTSLGISGSSEFDRFILENKNVILNLHGHIHETGGLDEILGNAKIINCARTVRIIEIDDNSKDIRVIR